MMLYPIDEQIEQLLESTYDPETGAMYQDISEEDLQAQIEALQMEFDEKIKSLRNAYLATCLEADCIAAEASALYQKQQEVSKRAKSMYNRAERIKNFIAYLLKGEKFQKDGCKITNTTRQITVIEDGFIPWAQKNAPYFLKEPEIRETDVMAALKAGKEFEFAHQEPKTYINIK